MVAKKAQQRTPKSSTSRAKACFCSECGSSLETGWKFCPQCGTSAQEQSDADGGPNADAAKRASGDSYYQLLFGLAQMRAEQIHDIRKRLDQELAVNRELMAGWNANGGLEVLVRREIDSLGPSPTVTIERRDVQRRPLSKLDEQAREIAISIFGKKVIEDLEIEAAWGNEQSKALSEALAWQKKVNGLLKRRLKRCDICGEFGCDHSPIDLRRYSKENLDSVRHIRSSNW
jgi:hypothetical protein